MESLLNPILCSSILILSNLYWFSYRVRYWIWRYFYEFNGCSHKVYIHEIGYIHFPTISKRHFWIIIAKMLVMKRVILALKRLRIISTMVHNWKLYGFAFTTYECIFKIKNKLTITHIITLFTSWIYTFQGSS